MDISFEKNTFSKRIKSMLHIDFRRLFTSSLFYIFVGACFIIPILILVMTTMIDGQETINQQTGQVTVMEGFDNVWQIIGSVSQPVNMDMSSMQGMDMSITSMCNINMLYFGICVFICLFVGAEFRSGYAKNLFTVRANKTDYVISKTVVCIFASTIMIIAFFLGSMIGGVIMKLPFDPTEIGATYLGIVCCILSKIALVGVFVPIYLVMSVITKQRVWLSILLSCAIGMLLFMMIPMITPLDATPINIVLCLVGSLLFSIGLGVVSNIILKKTALI